MNQRTWAIIVSALSDFVISGGGALITSMTAASQAVPSTATLIFAGATGLIQAARGVQKLLSPPPSLGTWRLLIEENADGAFSHIAEHPALGKAPIDPSYREAS